MYRFAIVSLVAIVVLLGCGADEAPGDDPRPADASPPADARLFDTSDALEASDGMPDDGFGRAVAASGDTLVVGAPYRTGSTGGAYVFRRAGEGWAEEAILEASDAAAGAQFGGTVAISGDTIVVGAPFPGGGAVGAAYVFTRAGSSWTEQARLISSISAISDHFGHAVGVNGDTLVASADDPDTAYVFTRAGTVWSERATLTGDDADFGSAVAISDGMIVVGARYDDLGTFGEEQGAGYVFVGGDATWTRQDKLTVPTSAPLSDYGASVALDGDTIALGGPGDGELKESGAVAVFVRTGTSWARQAVLEPSDPTGYGFFSSVALAGDLLAVGAPGAPADRLDAAGVVYVFARTGSTWSEQVRLASPDPAELGRFAQPAFADDALVVGEAGQDHVHVYER